ncbi:SRPBCC family protein [Olivibacter domesticus]|uniref:Ligand-binding SRPBCC domain-containing protein n=1 Tax=Olivibacter domesticus TaxID=407022 RepID=A0A1H7ZTA2_OLID1|nr:SRPBCC family protein [Olivibacter domesticus]SEM61872.1 Ligand-binding SRPBCC domain-containing protein [Olivibacter domesticus]
MITINAASDIYTLACQQIIPISVSEAWRFFSSPQNLVMMTPPKMQFEITNGIPAQMYEGQIITYLVCVLPFVKTKWVTEITHVNSNHYFVDEQRFGPYAMWHHEHRFQAVSNGTLVQDKVTYKLPLGWLGNMLGGTYVKQNLTNIFEFRSQFLRERFGDV